MEDNNIGSPVIMGSPESAGQMLELDSGVLGRDAWPFFEDLRGSWRQRTSLEAGDTGPCAGAHSLKSTGNFGAYCQPNAELEMRARADR
jgi:hypothetical protein